MLKNNDLTYYHDINFEWLASYLHNQLDTDLFEMLIQPIGIFARHVNHDVEAIRKISINGNDTLKFDINRDGIYDNLPHGLFHKSLTTQSIRETNDKVLESIKIENEKERHARSFFQIFESEILRSNVVNRLMTLNAEGRDFGFAFDQLKLLLPFNTEIFEREELVKIMQLFPFYNNVKKKYLDALENAISYILDVQAEVNFFCRVDQKKISNPENILDDCELGWNFSLGDIIHVNELIAKVSFDVSQETLEIIPPKIKLISEWILPLYYNIELNVKTENDYFFTVGDESFN